MKQTRTLLDEIESDALDPSVALATALRKCVALGGRAKSADLRDWASSELKGYSPNATDIPEWRTVGALIKADSHSFGGITKGQILSTHVLPEFARETVKDEVTFYHGVGELEAVLKQAADGGGSVKLGFAGSADLAAIMTHEAKNEVIVDAIYHEVGAASIAGILDRIRTTLTELVAEMREGPSDAEGVPSAETATQAVHVAIHGNRNRVRLAADQTSGGAEKAVKDPWWKRWQVVSALVAGLATLTSAGFIVQRALS